MVSVPLKKVEYTSPEPAGFNSVTKPNEANIAVSVGMKAPAVVGKV